MQTEHDLLIEIYKSFNARDIDSVLSCMHTGVDWPNGMEGGRVHGLEGVREYWTRQFGLIDSRVEPISFETDESGRIVVEVHQVVRDLAGNIIKDEMVEHVYLIEDGLIKSMEIRKPADR
jgi:hypothetical protein